MVELYKEYGTAIKYLCRVFYLYTEPHCRKLADFLSFFNKFNRFCQGLAAGGLSIIFRQDGFRLNEKRSLK
jgi:hypothetical protein